MEGVELDGRGGIPDKRSKAETVLVLGGFIDEGAERS